MAPSSSPAERETDRALYSLGAFMALKHFLGSQSAPRHTDAAQGRGGLFVSLQRAAAWEKTSRHSISRRGPLPPLARGPCGGPAGMHTCTDARAVARKHGAAWLGCGPRLHSVSSCDKPPAPQRGLNKWSGDSGLPITGPT